MYKVFLSSTSRDLADYREAVHRALDGLGLFQLIKMEDFGARDANAKELCARRVRESDLLVGLMGHYYGSCPPGEAVSFTELEYRTAKDAGLPRLMFAAPDDFPIPASLRESDASFARQQALRCEVMTERVVAAFDTPEKLASAVTKALFVWHEERRKSAEAAAPQLAEAPAVFETIPKTETVGANPYRGLEPFRKEHAELFFGREAIVDQLWNVFLQLHATGTGGETPIRLLAVLGASGSGKSSVAQAGCCCRDSSRIRCREYLPRSRWCFGRRRARSSRLPWRSPARRATSSRRPGRSSSNRWCARARATTVFAISPSGCWTWAAAV
jgi:hypothetical protein